mmetsp:Transcript_43217/g.113708  ORF Transcript_43217/g.113708 Transcript_43217/m.113708 type:complete len:410 (-) Transcript_43217:340-1569(-)
MDPTPCVSLGSRAVLLTAIISHVLADSASSLEHDLGTDETTNLNAIRFDHDVASAVQDSPVTDKSVSLMGLMFAVGSSFFNGSFPVAARLQKTPLDPILFNGFVCIGAFLSSLLIPLIFRTAWVFTWGGFLAGVLFVFAVLFSFVAIPLVGLAIAQAVWSASAIIVSVLWGILGPEQVAAVVQSAPLTGLAVSLLVLGALVSVSATHIAQRLWPSPCVVTEENLRGGPMSVGLLGAVDRESDPDSVLYSVKARSASRLAGVVSAASVGVFGGSILVPFKFVPTDKAGLANMPSFGLGAVICGIAVSGAYWFFRASNRQMHQLNWDSAFSGILSGVLWNIGNVFNTISQNDPYDLPYGISYPILQCALVFGGLWGIYFFKEISGVAIYIFWSGAGVLAGGVLMLALFGPH